MKWLQPYPKSSWMDLGKSIDDEICSAITQLTGATNIRRTDSGYVIAVNKDDLRYLSGIRMMQFQRHRRAGPQTYWCLNSSEFDSIPYAFLVDDPANSAFEQIWIKNRNIHRVGAPAIIGVRLAYPSEVTTDDVNRGKMASVHSLWAWNGLLHRTDGPAYEAYSHYRIGSIWTPDRAGYPMNDIDEEASKTHSMISWDASTYEWYVEGSIPAYPSPMWFTTRGGYKVFDKKTGALDSVSKYPGVFFRVPHISWLKNKGNFQPVKIDLEDLSLVFNHGAFEKQQTSNLSSAAWNGFGVDSKYSTSVALDDMQQELLAGWNFFGEPFFRDPLDEMLTMSRVKKDIEDATK